MLGDVYRLRPGETRWTRVGRMPSPRNYARALVYRAGIYVVGGSTGFGDSHGATGSTVVERYVP